MDAQGRTGGELRVLVVDDDFRVAAVHAAAVDGVPGCAVVGRAATLAQARAALDAGVDLIVADEYLPDGSGSDLIGAADASVLLVTAADDPAIVRRALVRGAIGYLVKPFAVRALADRVAEYARFRETLDAAGPRDQAAIDALLGGLRPRAARAAVPKGRSAVTASAVADLLRESGEALTAVAVAEEIGISRATAQRYLSDLVDAGEVRLSLRYGVAGRPEHSYAWEG